MIACNECTCLYNTLYKLSMSVYGYVLYESVSACDCPMNLCCFVYMYEKWLYCSQLVYKVTVGLFWNNMTFFLVGLSDIGIQSVIRNDCLK